MKLLFEKNADVNADSTACAALREASRNDHKQVVELLDDAGDHKAEEECPESTTSWYCSDSYSAFRFSVVPDVNP